MRSRTAAPIEALHAEESRPSQRGPSRGNGIVFVDVKQRQRDRARVSSRRWRLAVIAILVLAVLGLTAMVVLDRLPHDSATRGALSRLAATQTAPFGRTLFDEC